MPLAPGMPPSCPVRVKGIASDLLLESSRKCFVSVATRLNNFSPCCWEERLTTFEILTFFLCYIYLYYNSVLHFLK